MWRGVGGHPAQCGGVGGGGRGLLAGVWRAGGLVLVPAAGRVTAAAGARWAHSPRHGGHPLLAPHRLRPQHRAPPPSGAFLVDPILFRFVDCFTSHFSLFTLQRGRNQKRLEYTVELRPSK